MAPRLQVRLRVRTSGLSNSLPSSSSSLSSSSSPSFPLLTRLHSSTTLENNRSKSIAVILSRYGSRCVATSASRWASSGNGSGNRSIRLTADAYPDIVRDPKFARLTDEHVAHFRRILGSSSSAMLDGGVPESSSLSSSSSSSSSSFNSDLEPFNSDWMRKYRGQSRLVLRPASTQEVAGVLRYCNEQRLAVVPQGGNTGLVGGSVPVFDEVVVSTSRMDAVESFDEVGGALVVGAGCVLETAEQHVGARGHTFPLDLGAKGSCQIGGNLSTNAGGLRLLRYGNLHGSVLGLEAVLPDGTVLDDLCTLRKNNTGYDLKQLFVGAEGTLGIVTRVAVQCAQRSSAVNVAFLGLPSFHSARLAFREAKSHLSEILSAFELMDAESLALVARARPDLRRPLDDGDHHHDHGHPFCCLVETRGSDADHDREKLDRFLARVMEMGLVDDGVVAQDETQSRALWTWREGIPECVGHWGGVYKYDVSLPLADMYALVEDTRQRLYGMGLMGNKLEDSFSSSSSSLPENSNNDYIDSYPVIGAVGYGHMGDSNLHLNVAVRGYDARVERALEPWVYEWIAARAGSISAEHGLGLAKKKYIGYSRSPAMVGMMRRVKDLFDPNGIMNPYKYI